MSDTPMVTTWYGKKIECLPREQLLDVINFLARELKEQKKETARWMRAGDPIKYLKNH